MIPSDSTINISPVRYPAALFIALLGGGILGNYLKFPIFLDVDFLFGSIFALLALQFFGLGRGILAGALIASYTFVLWNHPYAIVIMTAEIAVVGWLMHRRRLGMVQADTLYWLFIGIPLVYLFYHLTMHVPIGNASFIMIKQAINGIANALAARLIFIGLTLRSSATLTSYRETIYNLLAVFVLFPALFLLSIECHSDFQNTDQQIRNTLIQDRSCATHRLQSWLLDRESSISHLATLAAKHTPQEMQPFLDLSKDADHNFLRIGLLNSDARTVAYAPIRDELGRSNIGRDFSDRPFLPKLKQELKPTLSDMLMGRIGKPRPVSMLLAPVIVANKYNGFVSGVLNLQPIYEHLQASLDEETTYFTVLDSNGLIITSNRPEQKSFQPFTRPAGNFSPADTQGVKQWIPSLPPSTPPTERWKHSSYVVETTVGHPSEWRLILEQPIAPYQKALYNTYTKKLTLLFFLFLAALALSEFLSRRTVGTLHQLRTLTNELPSRLAISGKDIYWPTSGFSEVQSLIGNFKEMATSLQEQFSKIYQINASLEERIELRTVELQRSIDHWKSTFDSIPDIISILDKEHHIVAANKAMRDAMQGCNGSYEQDKPCYQLVHGLDAPPDYCPHSRLLLSNTQETQELFEPRLNLHLLVTVTPLYDENNNLTGSIHVARNITARKEMEENWLQAKEAAEAANIAKSRFLANMSHEIRTPMNGIIGLTELLLGTGLNREQRKYAQLIKRSGKTLVQLISDILDLAKIEAGRIELEEVDFDLNQELRNDINLMILPAADKGLKIEWLIAPDVPIRLRGDVGRLRQILLNLLGNAIKFSEEGSVSLHVAKTAEDAQKVTLHFLVEDKGIGIAADKLKTIFQPFTQADSSTTRKFGGSGLGLSISRQLAELLGGELGVMSEEGRGSTFWFTVNMKKKRVTKDDSGDADLESRSVAEGIATERKPGSCRLLLVEDDRTNQLVTSSILTRFGYLIDVADNGQAALQRLQEEDYSLVLMDCMMPVMNGYEATKEIRDPKSFVRNHTIPIIALTANAFSEDRQRCLDAGMNDYLCKPIDIDDLLALLEKWTTCELPAAAGISVRTALLSNDQSLFEQDKFVENSMGDQMLAREVAALFVASAPEYMESILKALAGKDAEALRQGAHKLKGAAANLALPELSAAAARLEESAEEDQYEEAKELATEVQESMSAAIEAIKKYLLSPP